MSAEVDWYAPPSPEDIDRLRAERVQGRRIGRVRITPMREG